MLPPRTFLAYTPYPSLAAPTVWETVGSVVSPHRRTPRSSPQGAQLLPLCQRTTAPGSGFSLVLHIPPRHCLLLSPAQEQRSVESRRDLRCPQRRWGEFPSPPLEHPSHHTLPAILCPTSSCISLEFIWQPLPPGPNRRFSPRGLRPMLAGSLTWRSTLLFVLPQISWR